MKVSAETLKALVARGLVVARDLAGLGGLLLMVHGVGMIYAPAAWIFGGAVLVVASWASAGKKAG